jgi:hypothetical protein
VTPAAPAWARATEVSRRPSDGARREVDSASRSGHSGAVGRCSSCSGRPLQIAKASSLRSPRTSRIDMAHAHPVTAEGHLLHRSVLPIGSPRPAPGSLVNRLASTRGIASPDSFRDRGEGFGHLLGRALPHLRSAFTSATGGVWAPRPSRIRSKPIRPRERHILDELGPTSNPLDSDGRRGSGASILLCLQHGQPRTAGASAGGRTGAFDPMVLSGNPPPVAGASAFPVPTRGAGAQARAGRRASGRSTARARRTLQRIVTKHPSPRSRNESGDAIPRVDASRFTRLPGAGRGEPMGSTER